jgi:Domain of unknown function (DUF1839)
MVSLLGLDPASYAPSRLHGANRTFRETNCYLDLWIEILHSAGLEPASALSFAVTVDFEGDQWTFSKPPVDGLRRLYGIDVHEMQLYRPAAEHAAEQIPAGRTLIIEADSYYLPDTQATAYRRAHVKSSIAIEAIDTHEERLRYFHGAGYFELSGDDYRGVFRIGRVFSEDVLPPYAELVRFDAGPRLEGEQLQRAAREGLLQELQRRPRGNPWIAFGARLKRDLPELLAGTESYYHAYAFATVRQCGAAFECARSFVDWFASPGCRHARTAAEALERQVNGAKNLLFKLARRHPFDPAPAIQQLAEDWDIAMRALDRLSLHADGAPQ